jgi:hypothetical protein
LICSQDDGGKTGRLASPFATAAATKAVILLPAVGTGRAWDEERSWADDEEEEEYDGDDDDDHDDDDDAKNNRSYR